MGERHQTALLLLIALSGCERPGLPLEGQRCPCLDTYVCCARTQTCHSPGEGPCASAPPPILEPFVDRLGGSGLDGYAAGIGLTIADVDDDGRWDLFFPSTSGNTRPYLFRGLGAFVFEDITGAWWEDLVEFVGTPADDFDGDGRIDLLALSTRIAAVRGGPTGVLLRNQGAPLFEPMPQVGLLEGATTNGGLYMGATMDLDADGDVDLVAARSNRNSANPFPLAVAINEGGALVEDPALVQLRRVEGSTIAMQVLSAGDFDRDGDPDVVACHYHVTLLRNESGRLVDVTAQAGLPDGLLGFECASSAFVDFDGDGDLDIALVADGDFGASLSRSDNRSGIVLFENQTEADAPRFVSLPSMEAAGARFDCPAADHNLPEAALRAGADDAAFGDFDLDGDIDIVLPRPFFACVDAPVLYESRFAQGEPAFSPRALAGLSSVGAMTTAAAADLDGDGDLDVVAHSFGESRWALFQNNAIEARGGGAVGRFLLVEALTDGDGDATDGRGAARRAQGVTIELDLDGPEGQPDFQPGPNKLMARAISATGQAAQYPPVAHFGLGPREAPVWARVRFADGTEVIERVDTFDRTIQLVDR